MKRLLFLILGYITAIAEAFKMSWQLMRTGEVTLTCVVQEGYVTQNGKTRKFTEEEKEAYEKAFTVVKEDFDCITLKQAMERMDEAMRSVKATHQAATEAQVRAEEILRKSNKR